MSGLTTSSSSFSSANQSWFLRKVGIGSAKVNPLRAASALFLISSPFMTWITIVSVVIYQNFVVFGAAAQSNLLQISMQQPGMSISGGAALEAAISAALLCLGGLLMFRTTKVAVPLATAGLLSYLLPFYHVFGSSTSGLEQTFISPGIGFFGASAGIALGLLSPIVKAEPIRNLLEGLWTRRGISNLGAFLGTIALSLDVANHYSLGQLEDFIGTNMVQQALHLGLILGVASALLVVASGNRLVARVSLLFWIGVSTLALLSGDAAFSILSGNLQGFLGHNPTETILHLSIYYGAALVTVSGLVGRE